MTENQRKNLISRLKEKNTFKLVSDNLKVYDLPLDGLIDIFPRSTDLFKELNNNNVDFNISFDENKFTLEINEVTGELMKDICNSNYIYTSADILGYLDNDAIEIDNNISKMARALLDG